MNFAIKIPDTDVRNARALIWRNNVGADSGWFTEPISEHNVVELVSR